MMPLEQAQQAQSANLDLKLIKQYTIKHHVAKTELYLKPATNSLELGLLMASGTQLQRSQLPASLWTIVMRMD